MTAAGFSAAERLEEVGRQHRVVHELLELMLQSLAFGCRSRLDQRGYELVHELRVEPEFDAMGHWSRTGYVFEVRDGASGMPLKVVVMLSSHFEQTNVLHVAALRASGPHGELAHRAASTHARTGLADAEVLVQVQHVHDWLAAPERTGELLGAIESATTP